MEEIAGEPLVLTFAREFVHFFAIILWVAAALAFFAEWKEPGQGMATLGFAIIGVIVINGMFSFWQAYRAERALAVLKKLLPHATKVAARRIRPADGFRGAGARRPDPAGGRRHRARRLPAGGSLRRAGEQRHHHRRVAPASRDAEPCDEVEMLRQLQYPARRNLAWFRARPRRWSSRPESHSAFGQIARLTQPPRDTVSPLQTEIVRVSRIVAGLAVTLGVIFFFIGRAIGLSFWENFIFAIGIIVANVPEGLLPTVTLSLAMASQRMARRNALVRHLPAVEALGCTTVICTDKTGTLTQNRMAAKRLFIGGELIDPEQIRHAARPRIGVFSKWPPIAMT